MNIIRIMFLSILFINISITEIYTQKSIKNKLTNKYWGIHVRILASDTVIMDIMPNRESTLQMPYKIGLFFKNNNTFEEINKRSCGYDFNRLKKGTWKLESNQLLFYSKDKLIMKLHLISITDSALTVLYLEI